jgi:signal transduction histidine kinase/HD-GYP domain-containing protein (c-di-GMP phosphodiesterase class II)
MTWLAESIFLGESIRIAYVLVMMLLSGLVLFALWRGRETVGRHVVAPLYAAIPAFAASRLLSVAVSPLALGSADLALFTALNLVGCALMAASLLGLASNVPSDANGSWLFPLSARRLRWQTLYFGVLGLFLYVLRSPGPSVAEFIWGLMSFGLIVANLRVLLFVLRGTFILFDDKRFSLRGSMMLFSASWLLLHSSPVLSLSLAVAAGSIAHVLDCAVLVIVIAGLTSKYVLVSDKFRNEASEATSEKDAAKAELTKLSNIATHLYEDSSDLIKRQKEQTLLYMKKADSLEKILQIGVNIQRRHRLDDVFKMIVEMIRENVGFNTVTLRLLNKRAQTFETRAHVGLADADRDSIVNYRIPIAEYQKMIKPRFRISRSYFIKKKSSPWLGEDLNADETVLVEDSWREIDMLIVPLLNEDQVTVGYLSVENPENPKLCLADVIDTLENVAALAVIAIRNARFLKELEVKNEKLTVYAEKLSGLNKLKANFVQTISHEFRTPLTSIRAYCETLIRNADTVERGLLKEFLRVIEEESGRLMTLIEDILDFSQLESGVVKFERTPCVIQDIVKQAVDELRRNFESKRVTLDCDVPEQDVTVNGSADQIRQLTINLLHNASKFTRTEGNVWLSLREDPGCARIVVEDDGVGIPDGQLGRIFDQFYQADNSSTREHGGSGLGLATCKRIVEWHDGRIWVENVPGGGARFIAVIPKKEVAVNPNALSESGTVRRFEIERFLELLVENVVEFLNVGKVSIMLVDKARKTLRIECAIGMDEEVVSNATVKMGEGIAGKVAERGETMLVTDIEEDAQLSRSNNDMLYVSKSFLSVPVMVDRKVIGVVNVASPLGKPALDEHDARLLETVVRTYSIAIGKLKTFVDASARFEKVRETFKAILDSKRYIDVDNSDFVTAIALKAVAKLGLGEDVRGRVHYLLNVYDLGLSKVGFHIIKNPRDLSPRDREEIQSHSRVGHDMLASLEEDPAIRNITLCHHENFDGTGYPGQLKGESIPIEARIIRVADSLRALVSSRPYQRQYTMEEALDVLKLRAGTFFDPKVVDAFASVMNEARDDIPRRRANTKADETVEKRS